MGEDLKQQLLGNFKSENPDYEDINFDEVGYSWGKEQGRWAVQGNEIWLLNPELNAGTKWFFKFDENDKLIFYNPEDFNYLGKGEYIYFQMTQPDTSITFIRN